MDQTLRLLDQMTDSTREELSGTFSQRHRNLERCCDVLRETLRVATERGFKSHVTIWNACLFVNTVDYDLSILVHDLAFERDEWRRRFIARSLALVIFEIAEDLPAVFGKDFRAALDALAVPVDLRRPLDVQLKAVSILWDQHRSGLKEIRTVGAAHRDHDALRLLDLLELLGLGLEIGRVINDLGPAAQQILNYTSFVEPPELREGSS